MMGTNFWDHNVTAASNTTIGGISATGASAVSNFDNIVRDIAAQLRRFANDQGGTTTVGGSADVITLTTAQTITAYVDGLSLAFIAGADNTVTGVTANVDTIGAKTIKKAVAGAETALAVGDVKTGGLYGLRYRSAWASAAGAFQLIDLNSGASSAQGALADSALQNVVEDTTPQLGGPLDTNDQPVYWSKGADVASATALTLGTDGNSFDVTGTTTITSIDTWAVGGLVILQFDGALTLTHHATDLILPDGEDITTVAGDIAMFNEYASGDWRCVNYQTASAASAIGFSPTATWQNVNGSRTTGVSYQNTTGNMIAVYFESAASSSGQFQVSNDNSSWFKVNMTGASNAYWASVVIPVDGYYRQSAGTKTLWLELRA